MSLCAGAKPVDCYASCACAVMLEPVLAMAVYADKHNMQAKLQDSESACNYAIVTELVPKILPTHVAEYLNNPANGCSTSSKLDVTYKQCSAKAAARVSG